MMPCRVAVCVLYGVLTPLALDAADAPKPPAGEKNVTAEDLPRVPPTEPAEALQTFRLANGCRLELVAHEPAVSDPVAACFDAAGRMYVAEMHGYPFSHEPTRLNPEGGGPQGAGVIRRLEDRDGDGVYETSVAFATGLDWPTSVCPYDGGVFVLAPPEMHYLKDTDDDGLADERTVILTGFGRGNVQALANGMQWGPDFRIYFSPGSNANDLRKPDGTKVEVPRRADLAFDPKSGTFTPVTGGGQFGSTFDAWGTRYLCSNSDHIRQVVYPLDVADTLARIGAGGPTRSIAADGANAQVFRISPPEPWRIIRQKWRAAAKGYKLVVGEDGRFTFQTADGKSVDSAKPPTEYPTGYFTSATGITIYRSDAYPEEYHGNVLVGDVGGNLLHRKHLDTSEVIGVATRADAGQEIVASTDPWFRPVNCVNAPDGTLLILDMYRETIEHPHSIPEEIKQHLDLRAGHDRGRIYRLVPPGTKRYPVRDLSLFDAEELVPLLDTGNAWQRETVARLMYERGSERSLHQLGEQAPLMRRPEAVALAVRARSSLAPWHSVATLSRILREHPDAAVRVAAVQRWRFGSGFAGYEDDLSRVAHDSDPRVRFALAQRWNSIGKEERIPVAIRFLGGREMSKQVRTMMLCRSQYYGHDLLNAFLDGTENPADMPTPEAWQDLSAVCGASSNVNQLLPLLERVLNLDAAHSERTPILLGLAEGRRGHVRPLHAIVSQFVSRADAARYAQVIGERLTTAVDPDQSLSARRGGLAYLSFASDETLLHFTGRLLVPSASPEFAEAALDVLSSRDDERIPATLLKAWPEATPALRLAMLSVLLTRIPWSLKLLDAVRSGIVKPSHLSAETATRLRTHRDLEVRRLAAEVLPKTIDADRERVIERYAAALTSEGDVARGRVVFAKRCASCHRLGDVGHHVGPDLTSVRNKSREALLIAILDPNRESLPKYESFTIVLEDGRDATGIVTGETADSVVLTSADGKKQIVARSLIETLSGSGKSLMPEGLEKELTVEQMADLLTFLTSQPAASE